LGIVSVARRNKHCTATLPGHRTEAAHGRNVTGRFWSRQQRKAVYLRPSASDNQTSRPAGIIDLTSVDELLTPGRHGGG